MTTEYIEDFKTRILSKVAEYYKKDINAVSDDFNKNLEDLKKSHPKLDDNQLCQKVLAMLNATYGTRISNSSTNNYVGIIVGISNETDRNKYTRDSQLQIYKNKKNECEASGDMRDLNAIIGKVVTLDENNEVKDILFPFYKKNGEESAMGGKVIPSPEDSMIRTLYGISYPENSENPEKDIKVTSIQVGGDLLKKIDSIPLNKVVTFNAGGNVYNGDYNLNTTKSDFVEFKDTYLTDGIEKVGLYKVILQTMDKYILKADTIIDYANQYADNGCTDNVVPKECKKLVVVPNVNINTIVFKEDKSTFGSTLLTDNFSPYQNLLVQCDSVLNNKIDFAVNSSALIVGTFSVIGKEQPVNYINAFGFVKNDNDYVPISEPTNDNIGKEEVVEETTTNNEDVVRQW